MSEVLYIDVRRPEEYVTGHIPGAINISIEEHDDAIDKLCILAGEKTIKLYCYSSVRSAYVQSLLSQQHGLAVDHLDGGLMFYQGELAHIE